MEQTVGLAITLRRTDMQVIVKDLQIQKDSEHTMQGALMTWTRPIEIDMIGVYPSYVLLALHYASGAVIKECISSADLYSRAVQITDLDGRPINPWLVELNDTLGRRRDDESIYNGTHRSDEEYRAFNRLYKRKQRVHEGDWI